MSERAPERNSSEDLARKKRRIEEPANTSPCLEDTISSMEVDSTTNHEEVARSAVAAIARVENHDEKLRQLAYKLESYGSVNNSTNSSTNSLDVPGLQAFLEVLLGGDATSSAKGILPQSLTALIRPALQHCVRLFRKVRKSNINNLPSAEITINPNGSQNQNLSKICLKNINNLTPLAEKVIELLASRHRLSFDEEDFLLRSCLADFLGAENRFVAAAEALLGARNLNGRAQAAKCETHIRIAEFFLLEKDNVSSSGEGLKEEDLKKNLDKVEDCCARAGLLIQGVLDESAGNFEEEEAPGGGATAEESTAAAAAAGVSGSKNIVSQRKALALELRHRWVHARTADAKAKFADACAKYLELYLEGCRYVEENTRNNTILSSTMGETKNNIMGNHYKENVVTSLSLLEDVRQLSWFQLRAVLQSCLAAAVLAPGSSSVTATRARLLATPAVREAVAGAAASSSSSRGFAGGAASGGNSAVVLLAGVIFELEK